MQNFWNAFEAAWFLVKILRGHWDFKELKIFMQFVLLICLSKHSPQLQIVLINSIPLRWPWNGDSPPAIEFFSVILFYFSVVI